MYNNVHAALVCITNRKQTSFEIEINHLLRLAGCDGRRKAKLLANSSNGHMDVVSGILKYGDKRYHFYFHNGLVDCEII